MNRLAAAAVTALLRVVAGLLVLSAVIVPAGAAAAAAVENHKMLAFTAPRSANIRRIRKSTPSTSTLPRDTLSSRGDGCGGRPLSAAVTADDGESDPASAAVVAVAVGRVRNAPTLRRVREILDDHSAAGVQGDTALAAAALLRVTQLMNGDNDDSSSNVTCEENDKLPPKSLVTELLSKIGRAAIVGNGAGVSRMWTPYAASDATSALLRLVLVSSQRKSGNGAGGREAATKRRTTASTKLRLLARYVWKRLPRDTHQLYRLGPKRLSELFAAAQIFEICKDGAGENGSGDDGGMRRYREVCDLLTRGDVLSRLATNDLALVLSSSLPLAQASSSREDEPPLSATTECEVPVLTAFSRRLRKVRKGASPSSLLRVLHASSRALRYRYDTDSQQQLDLLDNEVKVMAYTLGKQVLEGSTNPSSSSVLKARDIGMLSELCLYLGVEGDDAFARLLCDCLEKCDDNDRAELAHQATLGDMSRILVVLSRWKRRDLPNVLRQTGIRFLDYCNSEFESDFPIGQVGDELLDRTRRRARNIKDILLSSVELFGGHNQCVMVPYIAAYQRICRSTPFLSQCQASELSDLAWFDYRSRCCDQETLMRLASRILQPDVLDACPPHVASRILSSYTLAFDIKTSTISEESRLALSQLFESLGVHLLSSAQLAPADVSRAIHAYAKASYVGDIGIFDNLAQVMVSRLDDYTARQITQSLWACGKMMTWEVDNQFDEPGIHQGTEEPELPPYFGPAVAMAEELASRSNELSTKDVAQALWALGHLRAGRADIVTPLAQRAKTMSAKFNTRETANILWALGKMYSKDYDAVYSLTRRFSVIVEGQKHPTPQEAANILYALARLNIRDDDVFKNLTEGLLNQINDTSAQAIANCLWAHRAVHITPPQQLVDQWASQKLGLVAVVQQQQIGDLDQSIY